MKINNDEGDSQASNEMKISRNWSGMIPDAIERILREFFEDMAAPPNNLVADAVYSQAEVSVFENSEGKYTAYKVDDNPIFWICRACGHTTSFGTDTEYRTGGGNDYYRLHARDAHLSGK
ncbi:hypothetical protein IH992_21345 [Candidatus Poribacteria bacterium]|nr:hypothetical protein [Candidatus Poribacteria bacterium]